MAQPVKDNLLKFRMFAPPLTVPFGQYIRGDRYVFCAPTVQARPHKEKILHSFSSKYKTDRFRFLLEAVERVKAANIILVWNKRFGG